jgi:hypothetical protein
MIVEEPYSRHFCYYVRFIANHIECGTVVILAAETLKFACKLVITEIISVKETFPNPKNEVFLK